jgi:uncharacterized protein YndB with AHSA1/START domain
MRTNMSRRDALKITTPSEREVQMTRAFDAPRALVFEALTRPDLLRKWFLGPPGWTLEVCDMDLVVGGAYRFVWKGPGGVLMGMGGVYKEIVRPERIVATERFDESWYPGDAQTTNVLTEANGRTTLTLTVLYASPEARDVVLRSPMEKGVSAGYDRLEDLLASGTAESRSAG